MLSSDFGYKFEKFGLEFGENREVSPFRPTRLQYIGRRLRLSGAGPPAQGHAMSFRVQALLLQGVVAFAVLALAVTSFFSLESTNYARHRVRIAYHQLQDMMNLAVAANRYSEQIAELLLVGEPERPDFESARKEMGEAFARLRRLTLAELAMIPDPKEREAEELELVRLDQMQTLFNEIDRETERVFALNEAQRRNEAIALFRSNIENRLDAQLADLVAQGIADERQEVERVEGDANQLSRQLSISMTIVSILLLAIGVGAGQAFIRSFSRPIDALSAGALAIERGDLDHRIDYVGKNELGVLAQHFNKMGTELSRQHDLFVGIQADLERQVAERTDELAATNQRLTLVDQQRVCFLADASHELRTPLTALRGEAEVTLRGPSKPESAYREALENVVSQAAAMSRLVEDLLFLARSESGELQFSFKRIALSRVLDEASREVAGLARARDIQIVAELVREGLTLVADERRLRQALVIVLDNAIKYSNRGTSVEIVVDETDEAIVIDVRDQGAGIDPSEIGLVFERFHRTEASRAGVVEGSGLGLSIARWIVENHSGTIDVSSVAGEGTEVRICLPRRGEP